MWGDGRRMGGGGGEMARAGGELGGPGRQSGIRSLSLSVRHHDKETLELVYMRQ